MSNEAYKESLQKRKILNICLALTNFTKNYPVYAIQHVVRSPWSNVEKIEGREVL